MGSTGHQGLFGLHMTMKLVVIIIIIVVVVVAPTEARRRRRRRPPRPRPTLDPSVQCPLLPAPENGHVSPSGTTLRFRCNSWYSLEGAQILNCGEGETEWDQQPPVCVEWPRCSALEAPVDGEMHQVNPYQVRFTCTEGNLIGRPVLICIHGNWSSPPPTCFSLRPQRCEDPGTPENGYKSGGNYIIGGVVRYGCYANYRLIGPESIECRAFEGNLIWTRRRPRCEEIDPVRELAENIRHNVVEKFSLHTASGTGPRGRLGLVQPNGLDLVLMYDRSSSIAPEDFKRSINFTLYLLNQFGVANTPNATHVAAVTFGSDAEIAFNLDHYDNVDEIKAALNRIQSTGGGTAMYQAFSQVFTNIANGGKLRDNAKRVIFMMSDGQSTDELKPDNLALQLRQNFLFEIFAVGVGNDVDRDELKRVASPPFATHVFSLSNFQELADLTDYILETKPEYERCGVAGDYEIKTAERVNQTLEERREINEGAWPWLVNIFDNDLNRPRAFDPICGGALICGNWVLTAAQCLERKMADGAAPQLLTTDDMTLYFGNHDILKGSVKEEYVVNIKQLMRHPNYDYRTLSNDIALIELGYNVTLNKYVRTVCVPQEESHVVQLGISGIPQHAWTVGWGTTRDGDEAFNVARQRKQKILGSTDCRRFRPTSVPLDDNKFCAGYRLELSPSCRGDIGAPYVATQDNDYFSVFAVVTHNAECDQLQGISLFTSVLPHVSWIHNITGGCNTASNCQINC